MHQLTRTKCSETSHILDPSYLSTANKYPTHIYVDCKGNIHDPDYRYFPVLSSSYAPTSSSDSPMAIYNVWPHRKSGRSSTRGDDNDNDNQVDYFSPFAVNARRRTSFTSNMPQYLSPFIVRPPSDDIKEGWEWNSLKDVVRSIKWGCASLYSTVKEFEIPLVDRPELNEEVAEEEQYKTKRPTATCSEGMVLDTTPCQLWCF
ncbi:uncharacterized protein BT62DRAFT_1004089 [Guyanagaster necrorhizus]|uniref:Uncharacterized protein n=1 Tax=Guyanagaster necrorhizus TaxID=856835 RepID=A0A9P7VYS6_9AGAR|nr:uncharacterized protein BT62DRAFT_1004089 [Guyanagaster necrorhizus MCA 3950]KAG7448301.1 hypothetical protein BT62DRAFT_1004089 [Guyanagaster necrorhizus MCA 3950]